MIRFSSGQRMLIALAWLAAPAPLVAEQPPAAPAPAKQPRICRESEQQLGSHIRSSRRCLTAEQWRQEDEAKGQVPLSLRVTEGQDAGKPPR